MPIPLSTIPEHIQKNIIGKVGIHDFREFQTSSRRAWELGKSIRTPFTIPWLLTRFTAILCENEKISFKFAKKFTMNPHGLIDLAKRNDIRFDAQKCAVMGTFDDNSCEKIIEYLTRTGSTVADFAFRTNDVCFPALMKELLRVANCDSVGVSRKAIDPEYARNLPKNINSVLISSKLSDSDLKPMHMSYLDLQGTEISSHGLNGILKEWMQGKRNINSVEIVTNKRLVKKEIFKGIRTTPVIEPVEAKLINNGSQEVRVIVDANRGRFWAASGESIRLQDYEYGENMRRRVANNANNN